MIPSKENPLLEYDKKLDLSINFLEQRTRNSIAQVFHTHNSFLQFISKQHKKEKELFYDWKEKVDLYMKNFGNSGKQVVFLFDIDETLAVYGSNVIRPAGEVIVQYIKQNYKETLCGLCSARDKESVDLFASINIGFDSNYIFTTREISSDINELTTSKYGLQTNGSRNKYNAWNTYSTYHPDIKFVLIDDLFDDQVSLFEEGIAIPFDKKFMAMNFDIYDYI